MHSFYLVCLYIWSRKLIININSFFLNVCREGRTYIVHFLSIHLFLTTYFSRWIIQLWPVASHQWSVASPVYNKRTWDLRRLTKTPLTNGQSMAVSHTLTKAREVILIKHPARCRYICMTPQCSSRRGVNSHDFNSTATACYCNSS